MNIAKKQTIESRGFLLPVCIFGIAGLLILLSWFAAGSTAFAQPNGDGHEETGEQREEPEGASERGPRREPRPAPQSVPQIQGLECMTRSLGRIPTGPGDFTQEERIKVAQECLGGNSGPNPGQGLLPGAPQLEDATRCVARLLGRIPTSRADLSPEE